MSTINELHQGVIDNFELILNRISDVVLILNKEREVVYYNDAIYQLPVSSTKEFLGLKPGKIFNCIQTKGDVECGSSDFCKKCLGLDSALKSFNDESIVNECRLHTFFDNQTRNLHLRISSSPIQILGEELSLFIITDISPQKEGALLEETFYQLFQNMSSGVAIYQAVEDGSDFVFKSVNAAAERIDSIKSAEVVGNKVTKIFPGVEEFGILDVFRTVWKSGVPESFPVTFYNDGRIKGYRENYVFKLPSGEVVAIYDDVTKEKQDEEKLIESKNWLNLILDTVNTGILMIDLSDNKIDEVNKTALNIFDLDKDEVIGTDFRTYFEHQDFDLKSIESVFGNKDFLEASIKTAQGNLVPVLISSSLGKHNDKNYLIMSFLDIAKRKELEDELIELTMMDELTQIGNRRAFEFDLDKAINQSVFTKKPLSTIMIDIDYFKLYNDCYGHLQGDDTLKKIASIIKFHLKRSQDKVYRFGGEEFVVILPDIDEVGARIVADRIRVAIEDAKIPHQKSTVSPYVTLSMGISVRDAKNQFNEIELIDAADKKLYFAKESGRNQIHA